MRLPWQIAVSFNQDTGNGGGGGSGAGAAAGAGAGQGGAGAPGAAAAGAGGTLVAQAEAAAGAAGAAADWFPKDLDAKFKGRDPGETLTNLAKHLGEMPKPPGEAKDYAFKPADAIAEFFGTEADNQVVDLAKGIAHKHGFTQAQFDGFINGFYAEALSKGLISPPVQPSAEFTALGGKDGSPNEILQRGQQRLLAVRDGLAGLETAGVLQKGEAALLTGGLTKAGEVVAMERLLKRLEASGGGPVNGGKAADGLTDHERSIQRMYPTMVIK